MSHNSFILIPAYLLVIPNVQMYSPAGHKIQNNNENEGGGVVAQQVMRSEMVYCDMGERRIFCWSVGAVPRAHRGLVCFNPVVA